MFIEKAAVENQMLYASSCSFSQSGSPAVSDSSEGYGLSDQSLGMEESISQSFFKAIFDMTIVPGKDLLSIQRSTHE